MTHLSENSKKLLIKNFLITEFNIIEKYLFSFNDVCLLILPLVSKQQKSNNIQIIKLLIDNVVENLGDSSTLITIGETVDLVHVHEILESLVQYQMWITIKRATPKNIADKSALPEHHFGALVHTKYKGVLNHTNTRIQYTYCPVCDKTTKDYGGKKHTYNSCGTLISDVWRDLSVNLDDDLSQVINRFADLFGIHPYTQLFVFNCRKFKAKTVAEPKGNYMIQTSLLIHLIHKNLWKEI